MPLLSPLRDAARTTHNSSLVGFRRLRHALDAVSGQCRRESRATVRGDYLIAAWAHGFGKGLGGAGFRWFVLSGFEGFGLADLALYETLPRLGSRLCFCCSIVSRLQSARWSNGFGSVPP